MAMICVNGARECTGCQDCYTEPKSFHCPMCGAVLDYGDTIYFVRENDEIIGCENCIGTKNADALEYF